MQIVAEVLLTVFFVLFMWYFLLWSLVFLLEHDTYRQLRYGEVGVAAQRRGFEKVIGLICGVFAIGGNVFVCSPHGLFDRGGVSHLGQAVNIALLSIGFVLMYRSRPIEIDSGVDLILIAVKILRGGWVRKIVVSAFMFAMAIGPFVFS